MSRTPRNLAIIPSNIITGVIGCNGISWPWSRNTANSHTKRRVPEAAKVWNQSGIRWNQSESGWNQVENQSGIRWNQVEDGSGIWCGDCKLSHYLPRPADNGRKSSYYGFAGAPKELKIESIAVIRTCLIRQVRVQCWIFWGRGRQQGDGEGRGDPN